MSSSDIRAGSFRSPTFEHARVEDVMHAGVVTCSPDTDIASVARVMVTHHIHAVLVAGVERRDGGERFSWGLLTSLDLVAVTLSGDRATEAAELARTEVVTVQGDEPLQRAAELMVEHGLTHLLVVSGNAQPIGIISTLDIAGSLAGGEV